MKQISHYANVVSSGNGKVSVQLTRFSACHNCDAKNGCGLMECQNKIITIPSPISDQFSIGENVIVHMSQNSGYWAVFLGYVLPLIIMIATLLLTHLVTESEIKSGISAIIILIPYYLWLSFNRKRWEAKFKLTVSKIEN